MNIFGDLGDLHKLFEDTKDKYLDKFIADKTGISEFENCNRQELEHDDKTYGKSIIDCSNNITKKLNEIIILDRFETKGFVNKAQEKSSPKGSGIASNDAF